MDPILAMLIYLAGFALTVFMLLAVFRLFRISADLSRIRQLLEYQAEQKAAVLPATSPAPRSESDRQFDRRADRIAVGFGASVVIITLIVLVIRALQ
jgi:hypothetical protein